MSEISAVTSVIIASEHPVAIFGIKVLLDEQDAGLKVVGQAVTSNELLALLAYQACDLLIIDCSLRYEDDSHDALLLLGRIRQLYPALAIIVLTAPRSRTVIHQMLDAGINAVVGKVAMVTELMLATAAVQRGRTYLSESIREYAAITPWTFVDGHFAPSTDSTAAALSKRESEIVRLYADGYSITQISERVHRSVKTISQQKNDAMRKLGLTSNSQLYEYVRLARLC